MRMPPRVQPSVRARFMAFHGTNPGMDIIELLKPWTEIVTGQVPRLELFDAHTHLGYNDPDGMRQSPEELAVGLQRANARGAFTFPFHEPDGYPEPNDAVLAAARKYP